MLPNFTPVMSFSLFNVLNVLVVMSAVSRLAGGDRYRSADVHFRVCRQPDGGYSAVSSQVTPPCLPLMPPTLYRHRRRLPALPLLLLIAGVEPNPGPPAGGLRWSPRILRCAVLNIRSAVNKAANVHDLIESDNIDVLVLTETWISRNATVNIKKDIAPPGYDVYHVHRPASLRSLDVKAPEGLSSIQGGEGGDTTHRSRIKSRGGGLAVVYRDCLRVTLDSSRKKYDSFESISVRISSGNRQIRVIGIYRPPPSATNKFYDDFTDLCDDINLTANETIICGDFNCPSQTSHDVEARLSSVLIDYNLKQHVNTSTRGSNILDLVISRMGGILINDLQVRDVGYSDHRVVLFSLNFEVNRSRTESFTTRNLKNFDKKRFVSLLTSSTLFMNPPTAVDDYMNQFKTDVVAALDQTAPLVTKTKRVPYKSSDVWITDAARAAKGNARRLGRRFKHTESEDDYVAYRRSLRQSTKEIIHARATYYRNSLSDPTLDAKSRWNVAKKLLHSLEKPIRRTESEALCFAIKISDYFMQKLINIRVSISKLICSNVYGNTVCVNLNANPVPLSCIATVTPMQVEKLISTMPLKFSPLDFLPVPVLKMCKTEFSCPLSILANLSFAEGCFPASLKGAQVTPLLKKPHLDASDSANYRPISNLGTIGKIIERLALLTLQNHITSSPNFCPTQSGYRKLHSTETAITKTVNDLLLTADSGNPSTLVTIDLSSAFDTINHDILMHRLNSDFGLSHQALNWVRSYLSNRHQYVSVGGHSAAVTDIISGVPQGSVLGPILFSAYTSPIGRLIDSFNVSHHHYADDTTLYTKLATTESILPVYMSDCISALMAWFLSNDMLPNPSKTEVMVCGNKHQLRKHDLKQSVSVCSADLKPVDNVKIIGVTLDKSLSFDRHVSDVCGNANYHIRALNHVRSSLTFEMASTLACSIVATRIDYCNSVLNGTSVANITRLQKVQNSLARTVCRAPRRACSSDLLTRLHWLPVQQRIMYKTAVLTYNALNTGQPSYLSDVLIRSIPKRALRSSNDNLRLTIPQIKTEFASRAFSIAAPTLWNSLSLHTRSADSIDIFKCLLKTELFTKALSGL